MNNDEIAPASTVTATKVVGTVASIGAINWGLIGFFNFNLVDAIFGGGSAEQTSALSRVIYAIVGICGVLTLAMLLPLHGVRRHGRPLNERPTLT